MRNVKEMLSLITKIAEDDERIKYVLMTGSRANKQAPVDKYQDFDIVYQVTDTIPFYNNMGWVEEKFGKPLIYQLPELMKHPSLPPDNDGHFTYLMIFEDGNRIDLTITDKEYIDDGEPVIILLDKDNVLKVNPRDDYFNVKEPNEEYFKDACNEFFWCLNNVGKGIMRDELPYVMEMYNYYVRNMLNQIIDWYIGIITDFKVSSGKMGKYYKKYLPIDIYAMYEKTYSDYKYENIWKAVFNACELFRKLGKIICKKYNYKYNQTEDDNMIKYLLMIKDDKI